jgi:hypothetical protein
LQAVLLVVTILTVAVAVAVLVVCFIQAHNY